MCHAEAFANNKSLNVDLSYGNENFIISAYVYPFGLIEVSCGVQGFKFVFADCIIFHNKPGFGRHIDVIGLADQGLESRVRSLIPGGGVGGVGGALGLVGLGGVIKLGVTVAVGLVVVEVTVEVCSGSGGLSAWLMSAFCGGCSSSVSSGVDQSFLGLGGGGSG
ncbi:hypothetical protein M569_16088 [Genlisea aurea]|uniref:Uncharacterized protein n=1 Tax=Genlisea aurea TaxID=192259 RepID=S8BVS8_9LAMI|nr:hypothetical protein M569_16088 [Genlisea aurea]